MAGRRKLQVDYRTANMTREALTCRAIGHMRDPIPPTAETQARLLRQGQIEETLVCRRCSWEQTKIIDMSTGEVVESKAPRYPEGYLIEDKDKGTGRVSRSAARTARYARMLGL